MAIRISQFSEGVHNRLRSYVYLLIDPRNGQTFYVGKGKGNRVFEHVRGALESDDRDILPTKTDMIREMIEVDRLEPIHVIHRHGMSDAEALAVEAALIDYIPGLANQNSGHGVEFRPANAIQLNERYAAEEMELLPEHNLMFIKTFRSTVRERGSIYEATRWGWRVNQARANRADYILSIIDGTLCEAVFTNCVWKTRDGAYSEFEGCQLSDNDEVAMHYLKKLAPRRIRSAQNMIGYFYD